MTAINHTVTFAQVATYITKYRKSHNIQQYRYEKLLNAILLLNSFKNTSTNLWNIDIWKLDVSEI